LQKGKRQRNFFFGPEKILLRHQNNLLFATTTVYGQEKCHIENKKIYSVWV